MDEFKIIQDILKEIEVNFQIEKIDIYDNIIFNLDSNKETNFQGSITFYPTTELKTRLIQFHFEFNRPEKYSDLELKGVLIDKNKELPYGNFNLLNNQIYYRYIMVCKRNLIEKEIIFDILNVMGYAIETVIDDLLD